MKFASLSSCAWCSLVKILIEVSCRTADEDETFESAPPLEDEARPRPPTTLSRPPPPDGLWKFMEKDLGTDILVSLFLVVSREFKVTP